MKIKTDISVGELLDKLSILEIKMTKITDATKLTHISHELSILNSIVDSFEPEARDQAYAFVERMRAINSKLWDIEDGVRDKEREQEFDEEFIELARSVYKTNDERFCVKNEANEHFKSDVVEMKSYEEY